MATIQLKRAVSSFVAMSVLSSTPSYAVLDFDKKNQFNQAVSPFCEKTEGRWSKRLAQWGAKAKADLSKDLFGVADIGAGYIYKVGPAFTNGLFTREDKYFFDFSLGKTFDLLEAKDSDFGVGLRAKKDFELTYYRHFENACQAELALPYTDTELPLDADRAIKNLNVGDYVTWKSNLTLVASLSLLQDIGLGSLPLKAGFQYSIRGSFQVHVLKVGEKKIRLKLVSLANNVKSAAIRGEYDGYLEIIPVRIIDKQLTRIADLNPLYVGYNTGKGEIFALDYILDLGDGRVADAYDQVISKSKIRVENVPNPIKRLKDVEEEMMIKISALEEVFQDEKKRRDQFGPDYEMKAIRTLKGKMKSTFNGRQIRLGVKVLAKYQYKNQCSKNKLVIHDENEKTSFYRIDSCRIETKKEAGLKWRSLLERSEMDFVFNSDEKFHDLEGINYVFPVRYEDKKFSPGDLESVKAQISYVLPQEAFEQIPFSREWNQGNREFNVVSLHYRTILSPDILDAFPRLSKSEIYKGLHAYIRGLSRNEAQQLLSYKEIGRRDERAGDAYERNYGESMERIAEKLAVVLDTNEREPVRVNAFISLNGDKLFRAIGLGYLYSLIPDSGKLKELVRFELKMTSLEGNRIEFAYGNAALDPVYGDVILMRALMENDGRDVLLASENLIYRRIQKLN